MSSGSLCGFTSLFSDTGLAVTADGTAVACGFGLGVTRFALLSFFAAFLFLAGASCLLTSSVMPQRSSRESCTPAEYCGRRGSISGFSSTGCACGFPAWMSSVRAVTIVSGFMAGCSGLTSTATVFCSLACWIAPEYRRMASLIWQSSSSIWRKSSAMPAVFPSCVYTIAGLP